MDYLYKETAKTMKLEVNHGITIIVSFVRTNSINQAKKDMQLRMTTIGFVKRVMKISQICFSFN